MKKAVRPDLSQRMKVRFPEFEAGWNGLVREVGPELVNFIQEKIDGHRSLLTELAKFKFKFVVDNNFIFGQIKGAIEKNKEIEKSFIYKLLSSRSIKIFAPPKLQEELYDKINLHIADHYREKAFGYAIMILSRIEIKDAQWIDAWKKANNLIGELDQDDVPYLALALEIESHAIMTFDDVFHRQGDVKVWKHGDADKIVTNYNSGFISFLIIEQTGMLMGKILAAIFRFIRDMIVDLVKLLGMIASGAITALSKIPWPVWVLIIGVGVAFWDEISKAGMDLFTYLKTKGKHIVGKLKSMVKEVYQLLKSVFDLLGLAGTIVFEFLAYLVNEYKSLNDQLKEMKFDKAPDFSGGAQAKQA